MCAYLCKFVPAICLPAVISRRGERIKYNEMNNRMSSLLFVLLINKYFDNLKITINLSVFLIP